MAANELSDWRLRLNNLLQATWGTNTLQWVTAQAGPQHNSPWVAIAYIRNVEWGRGQHPRLAEAKEQAAFAAYRALYREIYRAEPPM